MPSSFLIVPPTLVALAIFGWRYYKIDPERRIRNRDFLLGLACVATIVVYTFIHGNWPSELFVPWVAFGLAWVFAAVAGALTLWSPPLRKGLRSLIPH